MTGIIVIAHGSRKPETEAVFKQIMAGLEQDIKQQNLAVSALAYTFLEFAEPNLQQTLLAFAKNGIENIKVIPYFLFEGKHTLVDIPQIIDDFRKKHPHIKVSLGQVLGDDERLVQILADKVQEML